MMETMIPPQVGMRLWTLKKEKKEKKERKAQKKKGNKEKNIKMREKERRDNATIFFHNCASS